MPKPPLKHEQIRDLLPHRYPMLLVDRVLEVSDQAIVAEKLVSANEPMFQGHFPDRAVLPGVFIVEAMAQTAGIWAVLHAPENRSLSTALAGIDGARFRRPVVPGDVLRLHVEILRNRSRLLKAHGVARVDGEDVAEATVIAAFVDWAEEG